MNESDIKLMMWCMAHPGSAWMKRHKDNLLEIVLRVQLPRPIMVNGQMAVSAEAVQKIAVDPVGFSANSSNMTDLINIGVDRLLLRAEQMLREITIHETN